MSNRWLCYIKTGQYGYAYEDAIHVIKIMPDFVKAHYRLGLVYEHMNLLYEAYRSFKRSCELDEFKTKDMIQKIQEIKTKIETEYVFKGRPSVLVWGTNESGWWGIGVKQTKILSRLTPVDDMQGVEVSDLSWGVSHWIAIAGKSEAYIWGSNKYSQWGISTNDECIPSPILLKSLINHKVKAVACGAAHTLMTTNTSVVFAWGMNTMGQCGLDSDEKFIKTPSKVQTLISNEIQGIAWGFAHSFFLSTEGNLHCCGYNKNGQLGYGKTDNILK